MISKSLLVGVGLLTFWSGCLGLENFMDCPGNTKIFGTLRVCCSSNQLPKNCECFDISSGVDFNNSVFHKPVCPDDLNANFKLFNPNTGAEGAHIRSGQVSISASGYDAMLPTRIVVHGFTDSGDDPWLHQMKDELLAYEDCNVILVDWEDGAKGPNYYQAVANTRMVGAMLGRLVYDLTSIGGASLQDIHMIGHSLGAHIMGYAGKEVHRLTGQKLGRITGLDPAGPNFEKVSANVRVDKSDAAFVDIMHTDAELLIEAGFGIRYSIGHVDHYPNGGQHQPGCPEETYGILSLISFEDEKNDGACSHGRAIDLFTNSINRCRYDPPTGGENCTMGFHIKTECEEGDYYPETTATDPFCQ